MSRLISLCLLACVAHARVGDGWGTNIHWTAESRPGEAAMLAKAFKLARMDLNWAYVEKIGACGTYDFTALDSLLVIMKEHGVRPYWILDYGNACYPPAPGTPSNSCNTPACITAFGDFASAVVAKFASNNIIFECLNEPNGMGEDNTTVITALCESAGRAFHAAGETFVGPTTAGMDWAYLNSTFQDGILSAFSSVSVHPYRNNAPDSVVGDWDILRGLIRQHAPPGKEDMDVISGEWGYTTALPPCGYGNRVDELTQANYLARMWLANILSGVTVSIAYDWKDDGDNSTNCESNFGSVRDTPTGNAGAPFPTKPFYDAALTLQTGLGNADAFAGRVAPGTVSNPTARPYDLFALRFTTGASTVQWAVWSNATSNATCTPAPPTTDRLDCGYYGISEQECSARTCCWEANQPKVGGPQCYYSVAPTPPFTVTFSANPSPAGTCWAGVNVTGGGMGVICADASGVISMQVSDSPVYLL